MSLQLTKGVNLKLSKYSLNLNQIQVGLGWDINQDSTIKHEFDLDVSGIVVNSTTNKGALEQDVFFYNNVDGTGKSSVDAYPASKDVMTEAKKMLLNSPVVITKDNRTGEGDGDDETLFINASKLPKDKKVIILVTIHEAKDRRQTFGMVNNSYCRIVADNGTEYCRYDLKEDFSIETGVEVAEIYWYNDELKVRALGKGFNGNLQDAYNKFA